MQLPGRVLLMNGTLADSPAILLAFSLALHAGGLGLVAFGPSAPIVAAGTMVLALGNGLTTLVRPHVVQTMFSTEGGGMLNGRIARQQQLARAGGPILVAWLASSLSYAAVLAVFSIAFVIAALIALGALREERSQAAENEAAAWILLARLRAAICVHLQTRASPLVSGDEGRPVTHREDDND
jgi:predicted MFS family arabinose efflux permease